MKNFIQEGKTLTLAAPYDLASGEAFWVGGIFAVATDSAKSGDSVEGARYGVFTLPKVTAQAWTQGQKIYWDAANKRCDADSTVGPLVGAATVAADAAATTGAVVLSGTIHFALEGAQNAIADIATANATDATTAAALANSCKTTINALLAELRILGVIKP